MQNTFHITLYQVVEGDTCLSWRHVKVGEHTGADLIHACRPEDAALVSKEQAPVNLQMAGVRMPVYQTHSIPLLAPPP